MEKALIISFFKSENIGDRKLSTELLELVSEKYNVQALYDFSTFSKIEHLKKDETKNIPSKNNIKNIIKKRLFFFMSKRTYKWFTYHLVVRKNLNSGLLKDIKQADKVIIGGGNMLMDKDLTWPLRLKEVINLCVKSGVKVNLVFVGAGPIINSKSKHIYIDIFKKVEVLMVRDLRSKLLVQPYVSDKNINVEYDPALVFNKETIDSRKRFVENTNNISLGINIIGEECFSSEVANEKYISNMQHLIKNIDDNYIKKIFLFSTAENDYKNIAKIIQGLNNSKLKVIYIKNYEDVEIFYSKLSFLIGSRMHSLIFAQSMYLPYIALSWDNKVDGLIEMLDSDFIVIDVNKVLEEIDTIKMDIQKNSNNIEVIKKMEEINFKINLSRKDTNL